MADDLAAAQLRFRIAKAKGAQNPIMPMTASSPPASEARLAWEQPEVPAAEAAAATAALDEARMAAFIAQRRQTPDQFRVSQAEANRLHHSPEEWTAYLARQSDEAVRAQQRVLPSTTASLQAKEAPRSPFNWDTDTR